MRTLDELHDALDAYADRGTPRGAAAVLDAATEPSAPPAAGPGRRRWTLVAAAALVVLVVATVAVVASRSTRTDLTLTPSPPAPPGTAIDGTDQDTRRPAASTDRPTLLVVDDGAAVEGRSAVVTGSGLPPGPALLSWCAPDGTDPAALPCVGPDQALLDQAVTIADDGTLATTWRYRRSIYTDRWHDCATETCTLRVYPRTDDGNRAGDQPLATVAVPIDPASATARPTLIAAPAGPIAVGTTVTITGTGFTPGFPVEIGLCRAGVHDGSCWFDRRTMNRAANPDGWLEGTLELTRGTVGMPTLTPVVDCTEAPGTCSLAIYPMEGSVEPYAELPLTITP